MHFSQSKKISFEQALQKARKYCAYQERCKYDIEKKLVDWNLDADQNKKIISILEDEDFLHDERFAELYVRGKVHIKKWGKLKIISELKKRKIDGSIIQTAIGQIDEQTYYENLKHLLNKKLLSLKEDNKTNQKRKLYSFLSSKGYSIEEINKILGISWDEG